MRTVPDRCPTIRRLRLQFLRRLLLRSDRSKRQPTEPAFNVAQAGRAGSERVCPVPLGADPLAGDKSAKALVPSPGGRALRHPCGALLGDRRLRCDGRLPALDRPPDNDRNARRLSDLPWDSGRRDSRACWLLGRRPLALCPHRPARLRCLSCLFPSPEPRAALSRESDRLGLRCSHGDPGGAHPRRASKPSPDPRHHRCADRRCSRIDRSPFRAGNGPQCSPLTRNPAGGIHDGGPRRVRLRRGFLRGRVSAGSYRSFSSAFSHRCSSSAELL